MAHTQTSKAKLYKPDSIHEKIDSQKMFIDNILQQEANFIEISKRLSNAVLSIDALKALDVTTVGTLYVDNTIVLVKGIGLFYYDSTSVAELKDNEVVAPTVGSGRWLLSAGSGGGGSVVNLGIAIMEASWVLNGSTGYYEQQVVVEGITENSRPIWGLANGADNITTYERETFRLITMYCYNGYVLFRSKYKPAHSITVVIKTDGVVVANGIADLANFTNQFNTVNNNIATANNKMAIDHKTCVTYPTVAPYGTYAIGDLVINSTDMKLYKCITPISVSEVWTASHWALVPFGNNGIVYNTTDSSFYGVRGADSTLKKFRSELKIKKIGGSSTYVNSSSIGEMTIECADFSKLKIGSMIRSGSNNYWTWIITGYVGTTPTVLYNSTTALINAEYNIANFDTVNLLVYTKGTDVSTYGGVYYSDVVFS